MLEFFRRHKGPFMIAITVIIIVSFSVWGGWTGSGRNAGMINPTDVAFTIYGRDYSHADMGRLQRTQQLSYGLGMYELAFGLPAAAQQIQSTERGGPNYDFVGNLIVLREEALKYGVAASDDEAKKRMESLPVFQKDGKFDPAAASEMEDRLRANGFSTGDLIGLVKDQIVYERLQDLVGSNYTPSAQAVASAYAASQQTIRASTVTLALEDFKKKATVKDDEIAKYFEENKDTYKTAEKRAAAFVLFEKPKPDDKKKAEENAKAQTDYETHVNDFDSKFKAPGADIAKLVEEFKKATPALKLETIPAFERGTPPESIKAEEAVVKEIFRIALKKDSHSDPVEGSKGYYFIKITDVQEPKQQELKEVTATIKETLVAQKAQEALTKAANEVRTALVDGLKAGKKLDELTKGKEGWKVESLPDFTTGNPPPNNPNGQQIATDAGNTAAGGVTKPITTETGVILVVVTAKELYKRDDTATLKQSEESSIASQMRSEMFKAWFGKVRTQAAMKVAVR